MARRAALVSISASLLLAACGGSSAHHAGAPVPTVHAARASAARPATVPAVRVVAGSYGRALVDPRGYALYLFTRDRGAASRCYGACAVRWPPYLVSGAAPAGRLVGVTRRHDGREQLTYAGHPLYRYLDDRPGKILCQAADEFGGTWYVVAPDGRAIRRS